MIRYRDILRMAAHNLRQRKLRTALNLLGIVVGCVVLLMTAAGVSGVKDAIHLLFDSAESARQIGVMAERYPNDEPPEGTIVVEGQMSDERKERIRRRLVSKWQQENRGPGNWSLTPEQIDEFGRIPHVVSVVPDTSVVCTVHMAGVEPFSDSIMGADIGSQNLAGRLLAGRMPAIGAHDEFLVDEFVAYQFGYRDDNELEALIGQTFEYEYQPAQGKKAQIFRMMLEKWDLSTTELAQQAVFLQAIARLINDLDATTLSEEEKKLLRDLLKSEVTSNEPEEQLQPIRKQATICGVLKGGSANSLVDIFRGHYQGGHGGIVAPSQVAADMHLETLTEKVFYDAVVTVESTQHLAEVSEALENKNTYVLSALRIIERIDETIDQSAWIVYGIAAAILLTASIGISNTLLISVLERTPEIGILKSVGATNATVLWLMVCEGAILGVLGALLAVVISFALSLLGQRILQTYVEFRMNHEIAGTVFQFSLLPILGVVSISIIVCVIASILPAWRAARLDPVVAMRRT